jgi:hypothetical protein
LLARGYSASVVIRSLIALGHLGRWMEREALAVDQLTAEAISTFLVEYRSDCGRLPTASVWPLFEHLRAEGAVPPEPPAVVAPVEQLVGEYREWLRGARGLAPVTVRNSERLARRFLAQRVSADDRRGVRRITAAEVNDFLMRECARLSPGSAGCFTYRLRSLLRYLAFRGVADPGLALAVPRIARWREATIPQFPSRPEVDRLFVPDPRRPAAPHLAVPGAVWRRPVTLLSRRWRPAFWRGGRRERSCPAGRPCPGAIGDRSASYCPADAALAGARRRLDPLDRQRRPGAQR